MDTWDKVMRLSGRKLVQIGEALGFQNLDPDAGKILITGGTGIIGHRVAQRLLLGNTAKDGNNNPLRIGCHQTESLPEFEKQGAEIVEFDWNKEGTYSAALQGIKSVLCTIPYQQGWSQHFPAFIKACKVAGVKHIVKLSFYHANASNDSLFQNVPLVREHAACDEQLVNMAIPPLDLTPALAADASVEWDDDDDGEGAGGGGGRTRRLSYTIIHASHFMSNPFLFQRKELRESEIPGTYHGCSQDRGVNYVSPNDVAEVAVYCLLEPRKHYDKEYTITGPQAIPDKQVAGLLSKYLHKSIVYVDEPVQLFTENMSSRPDWMVCDLAALEEIKASGQEEDPSFVSPDFETICGHKPETFQEYLQRTEMMVSIEEAPPGGVALDTMEALPTPILA